MTESTAVAGFLILTSAVAHAAWNLKVKQHGTAIFTWMVLWFATLISGIAFIVVSFLVEFEWMEWYWPLVSGLPQAAYLFLLTKGYQREKFSVVYPLFFGSAAVFIPAVTFLARQTPVAGYIPVMTELSRPGYWLGVLSILVGLSLIRSRSINPMSMFGRGVISRETAVLGLCVGLAIAIFHLIDSVGTRRVGVSDNLFPPTARLYRALIYMLPLTAAMVGWFAALLAFEGKLVDLGQSLRTTWTLHLRDAALVAVGALLVYNLVLVALQFSSATIVVPLRSLNFVAAPILAMLVLREKVSAPAWAGSGLIAVGAFVQRL